MKQKIKGLFFLFILLSLQTLQAQINVVGIVTDSKGDALIGVNVKIKDLAKGTITDLNGKFGITVPGSSSILVFSYLGYSTVEIKVASQKNISVVLKEDAKGLDEVVVIGYGEIKRRDLTGAVGKADVTEMLKTSGANITDALAGRVAGVQVTSNEGTPGGEMNIVVRGTNSITGSNSPLYVIDGFPMEEGTMTSSINKNDIESFEILKDASATAIYGARGANGVVLITTKKGNVGAAVINYDGTFGVQNVTKKIQVMDAYEFVKLQAEMYPDQMVNRYFRTYNDKTYTLEDYRNIDQFNWQDMIFRPAITQNHSVSITGGREESRYIASLSYYDQEGILINTDYNRVQGKIGNTIKKGNLTVNLNVDYSKSTQSGSIPSENTGNSSNNLFYSVWGYRPVSYPGVPISQLADGIIDESSGVTDYRINPVLSLQNESNIRQMAILKANGYLQYEFIKGLRLKSSLGYTYFTQDKDNFNNSKTRGGGPTSIDKVNASFAETIRNTWLNENVLSYSTNFNRKHNINALIGYTMQGSNNIDKFAYATHITGNESLEMSVMNTGLPTVTTYSAAAWTMMSFLGRINYNYKSKYYATVSYRADGSSKFRVANKFGYFPSGSLAWNFTEEKFMKPLKDILTTGKLRVGWGVTGNNRVGEYDTYARLVQYSQSNGNYAEPYAIAGGIYPFNNILSSNGPVPVSLSNEALRWESTSQWNVGTDVSFFNQRLSLTVDLYNKITSDLLLNATLPYSSGYGRGTKNIGKTSNKGIEFSFTSQNIKSTDFSWTTSFNIAFNQNTVLGLAEDQTSLMINAPFTQNFNTMPNYIAKVGEPLGIMYGYIYEGTYKYNDFFLTGDRYTVKPGVPVLASETNTQPGFPKYKDINQDGIVDANDQTAIGRGAPINIGGISNEFSYKGFDLSIFFQWSYGNNILNANRLMFEGPLASPELNQFASYSNRWSPENPTSDIPRAKSSLNSLQVFSTRVVEDGSFLRLKNINLGYNLSTKTLKKLKLKRARIFMSADNIWVLTSYTGYDPEVSVRNSALTPGMDFSSYPRALSINGGINVSF